MHVLARSYNIGRITSIRNKIYDEFLLHLSSEKITGQTLEEAIDIVSAAVSHSASSKVIRSSMLDIIDLVVTKENYPRLYSFAWRIAGNTYSLSRGRAASAYNCQLQNEWVPVEVEKVQIDFLTKKSGDKVPGARLTLRVMAGSPASKSFKIFWPDSVIRIYKPLLGFSKKKVRPASWPANKPFLAFENANQLFGMRFYAYLTPESCKEEINFEKIKCPKSCLDHNKALTLKRIRHNFKCPFSYTHMCHSCPVGRDKCIAACHLKTYTLGQCQGCNKKSFFDKTIATNYCVSCANGMRTNKK